MHFADHRIAGDPAQFLGDLAGRLALGPHFLERFDTLVGPGHGELRLRGQALAFDPYSIRDGVGYKRDAIRSSGRFDSRGGYGLKVQH